MRHAIDTLMERIERMGNPTVAGLDTRLEYLPEAFVKSVCGGEANTLSLAAKAITAYNEGLIEALRDIVPAVKVQVAYYEMYGVPGMQAFADTLSLAAQAGMSVIADVKRGDIGATAEAYSAAYLGQTPLAGCTERAFPCDMVTINPYLGSDGMKPFLKDMAAHGGGAFALVKTSNPSSGEMQDVMVSGGDPYSTDALHGEIDPRDGGGPRGVGGLSGGVDPRDGYGPMGGYDPDSRTVYELVADRVIEWGAELIGEGGYSALGAVVGATYPEQGRSLRARMPRTFFLVPGYGAQGGTADDLAGCFDAKGRGAVVNNSRGLLCAWQKQPGGGQAQYAQAAREAALRMRDDIMGALGRRG